MKKTVIISIVAFTLVCAGIAFAAAKSSTGKVVKVDGKEIIIKLDGAMDVKAGDAVKVEAAGGKAGFKLQGC